MTTVLKGKKIVTPFRIVENGLIIIKDNKIYDIGPEEKVLVPEEAKVLEFPNSIITPGFTDLLVHGGAGGYGFSDENDDSIQKISDYFLENGSTTVMASLHAKPEKRLLDDFKRLSRFINEHSESNIRGIHMEGPYLNPELKGAMNANYLWTPSVDSFLKMWDASEGYLKLMTIAPELPGAIDVIREASFRGVVCSIGHSKATYEIIDRAIDQGAAHVTHMFNAMGPLHHRTPGVALAALLRDELKIELIADTYHVHPAAMELLFKHKTPKNIILITDSIRVGGMHEGEISQFSDQKITVKGNKAVMEDGTIAGSTLTLNKAIKNVINVTGLKLTEAVRMATVNGAKVVRPGTGIIASGKPADITVMDDNFEVLLTMIDGKIKYQK